MSRFPARPALTLATVLVTLVTVLGLTTAADATTGVERAQRRLNALGCDSGPADGVYGEWTRSAVVRFQSRHGLHQDGVLGPVTTTALYADSAQRCDQRPVPKGSGHGRRIVLSQAQNWVWLVGRHGRVVAQGGMVDNTAELAPGRYSTGSYCGRAARIARNLTPARTEYLENYVRFAPCGIGFHRIPTYVSTGAQIHPDYLLGTNERTSHGCIRLSLGMSRTLWNFTGSTTRVRVV